METDFIAEHRLAISPTRVILDCEFKENMEKVEAIAYAINSLFDLIRKDMNKSIQKQTWDALGEDILARDVKVPAGAIIRETKNELH
jgi:hypothetical protein